jgi:hypothetical protein
MNFDMYITGKSVKIISNNIFLVNAIIKRFKNTYNQVKVNEYGRVKIWE